LRLFLKLRDILYIMNFKIDTEYIELYQLLKVTGLCMSGGEAKFAITQEKVQVNGAVETRKKNKIRTGDQVKFSGETITVTD